MRVLMVGRSPSVVLEELKAAWGEVETFVPKSLALPPMKRYDLVVAQEPSLRIGGQHIYSQSS